MQTELKKSFYLALSRLNIEQRKKIAQMEEGQAINYFPKDYLANLAEDIVKWEAKGIKIITRVDTEYPRIFYQLRHVPEVIFCRGNISLLSSTAVTLVGSRNCEPFYSALTFKLASELASSGIVIISGLARGIDSAAHRGALENNRTASTIAVLGGGVLSIYPAENKFLVEQIIESNGLIFSQYEPESKPRKYQFVERNSLMAALSRVVAVVQASATSGALKTAEVAAELGKDVLAVPGDLRSLASKGCNNLIKQGAYPFTELQDILDFYPEVLIKVKEEKTLVYSSQYASEIISLLKKNGKTSLDELLNIFGVKAYAAASELEIKGIIIREPGNFISLKS